MFKIHNLFIALIGLILLSGCASNATKAIALPSTYKEQPKDVHMASFITQKEIDAEAPLQNNATMASLQYGFIGGLIGGAIDASINQTILEKKEAQLAPIRNALLDFNFNEHFHKTVENKLSAIDWLKIAKKSDVNNQSTIELSDGEDYFKIETFYKLSSDFTRIQVHSQVHLGKINKPKNQKKKKTKESFDVVFRNFYKYISPSIERPRKTSAEVAKQKEEVESWYQSKLASAKNDAAKKKLKREYNKKLNAISDKYSVEEGNLKAAEKWSQNNAELAKKYLMESAYEISKMILSSISDTKTIDEYKKDKSQKLFIKGFQLVREGENRVIVRDIHSQMEGLLCSTPKNAITIDC